MRFIFSGIYKFLLLHICLFFVVILSSSTQAEVRKVRVSKLSRDQNDTLDKIIQNYIPIISRETPENHEEFKKKLRYWNPQIKNWARIDGLEKIKVYHQTPLYDLAVGYHFYQSEETLDRGGTINTSNLGPTVDLRMTFIHDLEFFSYLNYRFLKKNDFVLKETGRAFGFPPNHSFEWGLSWNTQFSRWTKNLALSWEQFSYLSFNNDRFKTRSTILNNLQVSTTEIVWLVASLDYRMSIGGRGTYIRLAAGGSPYGTKSLDDDSKTESVESYKSYFSVKQYLYSSWWMRTYYQYSINNGATETIQKQFGLYTGFSF